MHGVLPIPTLSDTVCADKPINQGCGVKSVPINLSLTAVECAVSKAAEVDNGCKVVVTESQKWSVIKFSAIKVVESLLRHADRAKLELRGLCFEVFALPRSIHAAAITRT